MYFWNLSELIEVLSEKRLKQSALFAYFLISGILYQAVFEAELIWPSELANPYYAYVAVCNILIVGAGTYLCYWANGASSGEQFAERFISLQFVIIVRQLVFFVLPLLVVYAVGYGYLIYQGGEEADTTLIDSSFDFVTTAWLAVVYWLVSRSINRVAIGGA